MIRRLLHMWLIQKRRNFEWRPVIIAAYFYFLTLLCAWIALEVSGQKAWQLLRQGNDTTVVSMIALGFLIPDFLMKLFLMHPDTDMSDFVKTRPIPSRHWTWLLYITIAADLTTLFYPLLLLPLAIYRGSLTLFVVAFATSYLNATLILAFHKARGWEYKLPVFIYIPFCMVCLLFHTINPFALSTVPHALVTLLLIGLLIAPIFHYTDRLENYPDERKNSSSRTKTIQRSGIWADFLRLMRIKRLRVSFLILIIILPLNAYNYSYSNLYGESFVMAWNLFALTAAAMGIGQWGIGIEANYLHGLLTKPFDILPLLRRKYTMYTLLTLVSSLILLPIYIWMNHKFIDWVVSLVFALGVIHLILIALTLTSKRADLFGASVFSNQGFDMKAYIATMSVFVAIILYGAVHYLLPQPWNYIVLTGLGAAGLLMRNKALHIIADKLFQQRYRLLETD
uniref:Polysaccharide biosynthesis protein n=1 Tax=Prevotella sp. GTC17254 TaxID=3236794 RepID=A0AB33J7V3_9BACT